MRRRMQVKGICERCELVHEKRMGALYVKGKEM
jgi:hypothetical protein